jgi:hypothetical protein
MKSGMTPGVLVGTLLFFAAGCGQARPETASAQPVVSTQSSLFDAASTGIIRGSVLWTGELPNVPPFEIRSLVIGSNPPLPRIYRDNPNAPVINAETRGVAGAVVYLRKVDPRLSRPWDFPPVELEHRDRQLFVLQGDVKSRVGFVNTGDSIRMVSREKAFNILRADGAAFFSLTFPDPDQALTRVLKDEGLVELTNGAGAYWMRAYLFVTAHPYFARTDATGHFELPRVPPGRYKIVCWLPNWHKKSEDRDPESALVTRVFFHPPVEIEREVFVEPSGQAVVDFTLPSEEFTRHN